MLIHLLIRLSALSLGLTHVVCTSPQQTTQLATLHEHLNQMLSALYSTPLLSKVKASSPDEAPAAPETFSYPAPAPQVVYVSPPGYEGSQPNEFTYSLPSPVSRTSYYDYYQQQFSPVYSPRLYEYPRYPQLPAPQPVSYPPFAPPTNPQFLPVQYSRPAPYGYQPYPARGLPSPYLNQVSYPPISLPGPVSQPLYVPYSAPTQPSYPSPAMQSAYISLPQLAPSPYPPPVPFPSMPVPYLPSLPYPPPLYPAYPKPADHLPQPQYEYGS